MLEDQGQSKMKTKESLRYVGKLFKDTYRVGDLLNKDEMRKVQYFLHSKAWIGLLVFLILELSQFTRITWDTKNDKLTDERLETKLKNEHD